MKRRNFMVGIGALSVGSAAAVGTGAFSSAEAFRDVSVKLADDADAYLALRGTSQYAEANADGVLELDFGTVVEDEDENDLGEHVGEDSVYQFGAPRQNNPVFVVENQGSETAEVTPSRQTLTFDSNGNPVDDDDEDRELIIAIDRYGDEEVPSGEETQYLVQVSTGSSPPDMEDIDPEDAIFEINANEA